MFRIGAAAKKSAQRQPCIGCECWQIIVDGAPNYSQTQPIVPVAEAVAHAADIGPRLVGHQLRTMFAESDGRLANSLKTAFDSIA